eukprot:350923-Chlamydomonas_euryale.AAC.4
MFPPVMPPPHTHTLLCVRLLPISPSQLPNLARVRRAISTKSRGSCSPAMPKRPAEALAPTRADDAEADADTDADSRRSAPAHAESCGGSAAAAAAIAAIRRSPDASAAWHSSDSGGSCGGDGVRSRSSSRSGAHPDRAIAVLLRGGWGGQRSPEKDRGRGGLGETLLTPEETLAYSTEAH